MIHWKNINYIFYTRMQSEGHNLQCLHDWCVLKELSRLIKDCVSQESVLTWTAHLLEKVSLAGGGLGHLPAWGQGHVVRNLIRRLTEMLRGGTCWGHARQGATRNSSHLKGGRGRVGADMVGGECSASPSVSACLCWVWKKKAVWMHFHRIFFPSGILFLYEKKQLVCLNKIWLILIQFKRIWHKCDSKGMFI